jgi:aminoglycoside/choline kinase family phosphotransferase
LGHFDLLSKNIIYNEKEKKVYIFDFGDSTIGYYGYEFGNMNFPNNLTNSILNKYTQNNINIDEVNMHQLYSHLGFHINNIIGIEKVQSYDSTLNKLKSKLKELI